MGTIARKQIFFSAEGLLWASDVQEATQGAQDEGDFVWCPGHLGFSP